MKADPLYSKAGAGYGRVGSVLRSWNDTDTISILKSWNDTDTIRSYDEIDESSAEAERLYSLPRTQLARLVNGFECDRS